MPRAAATITPRQKEVLVLVAQGMTNKEIAAEMKISPSTVKNFIEVLHVKSGTRWSANRVKLALWAIRSGFAALALLLFCLPGHAAGISSVQGAYSFASNAVTFATQNTGAGDLYVLAIEPSAPMASGTVASVTDTEGNHWNILALEDNGTPFFAAQIAYTMNVAGGSKPTVTVSYSGSNSTRRLAVHEFSGAATVNALDLGPGSAMGASGAPTSQTVSPSVDGELVFGFGIANSGDTSAGAGFTLAESNNLQATEYQIQTTATPVAAVFPNQSGQWIMQVITFKPLPTFQPCTPQLSLLGAGAC